MSQGGGEDTGVNLTAKIPAYTGIEMKGSRWLVRKRDGKYSKIDKKKAEGHQEAETDVPEVQKKTLTPSQEEMSQYSLAPQ